MIAEFVRSNFNFLSSVAICEFLLDDNVATEDLMDPDLRALVSDPINQKEEKEAGESHHVCGLYL